MVRMKVLIVDDEAPARQRMLTLLEDIQADCPCELVGEAKDGQSALDLIVDKQPDILLLDVQMPGMTGIELAQHIATAELEITPSIIFVTAYDEFALKAFELHAMDYLLKPVRASRLQEAIERSQQIRALQHRQSAQTIQEKLRVSLKEVPKIRQNFSVMEKNRVLLIPIHEVIFLKAEQKYVTIQTKTRAYLTEESLVSIECELDKVFVRAHRNALVARDAIIGVEKAHQVIDVEHESGAEHGKATETWQVIVRDSAERLPISRRQWAVIKSLVRELR